MMLRWIDSSGVGDNDVADCRSCGSAPADSCGPTFRSGARRREAVLTNHLSGSTALIHRWRPSGPRTRPNHRCRSLTHQSSWPADQVAASTSIGGSTARRSASGISCSFASPSSLSDWNMVAIQWRSGTLRAATSTPKAKSCPADPAPARSRYGAASRPGLPLIRLVDFDRPDDCRRAAATRP
jgi:hypothetical protein